MPLSYVGLILLVWGTHALVPPTDPAFYFSAYNWAFNGDVVSYLSFTLSLTFITKSLPLNFLTLTKGDDLKQWGILQGN
jgi:hypothetical protein